MQFEILLLLLVPLEFGNLRQRVNSRYILHLETFFDKMNSNVRIGPGRCHLSGPIMPYKNLCHFITKSSYQNNHYHQMWKHQVTW